MAEALRYNERKPEQWYWLMWPKAAEAFCRVCEYGAKKYNELNFSLGGKPDKEYLSAAIRHLLSHSRYYISRNSDDLYDKESGCLHVSHAMWNIMMLIDYNMKDFDLYKKEEEKVEDSYLTDEEWETCCKNDDWHTKKWPDMEAYRDYKKQFLTENGKMSTILSTDGEELA